MDMPSAGEQSKDLRQGMELQVTVWETESQHVHAVILLSEQLVYYTQLSNTKTQLFVHKGLLAWSETALCLYLCLNSENVHQPTRYSSL